MSVGVAADFIGTYLFATVVFCFIGFLVRVESWGSLGYVFWSRCGEKGLVVSYVCYCEICYKSFQLFYDYRVSTVREDNCCFVH